MSRSWMQRMRRWLGVGVTIVCLVPAFLSARWDAEMDVVCALSGPLMQAGQDPSVVYHDGFYYLVQSVNTRPSGIILYKSPTISGLGSVPPVTIYTAPFGTAHSRNLWAPEIVRLRDQWYIYYAADDGDNINHRTYVLSADTPDPTGPWTFRGALFQRPELDHWAIDLVAFEYNGRLYAAWSGWTAGEASTNDGFHDQYLFIAELSDPLTVMGNRVQILAPTEPYERSVAPIIEGPQVYLHDSTLTIVYSADASWTQAYKLAGVTLRGPDPLDPAAWERLGVLLEGYTTPDAGVYGVGHNSNPIPSPDGSETWHLYHAKSLQTDGWDDRRIHAGRLTWVDGLPRFDPPLPLGQAQPIPAGEPCGLVERIGMPDGEALTEPLDTGRPLVDTSSSYTVIARVNLATLDHDGAIASQQGGLFSNFVLLYDASARAFSAYVNDLQGKPAVTVTASTPVEAGRWYEVALVADAIAGELRLYVDGCLAASAPKPASWRSARAFVVGAAKTPGRRFDFFNGMVDDVRIYNGALKSAPFQPGSEDLCAAPNP